MVIKVVFILEGRDLFCRKRIPIHMTNETEKEIAEKKAKEEREKAGTDTHRKE